MKFIITLISLFIVFSNAFAQDSLNMTRLSSWTSSKADEYNDCWGYTDSLGNEYAIVGSNWGTHFINVTDPQNPDEIDYYIGYNDNVIWRDYKVKGHYAYGVADNFNNSLQIFDLSGLPEYVDIVYDDPILSQSAHNIYIEGDRAYLCSNVRDDVFNALDVLNISDPLNPFIEATFDDSYFGFCSGCIHDIYVKNNIAYCSAGYEGMYIYDLTDLTNPIFLAKITDYTGHGYNHSSWVHEDGEILVMADEVPNSLPLNSYDISDFNSPTELAYFTSYEFSTDTSGPRPHNPFFVKNDLVVSYYYEGLQVFDFTDPSNPVVSAFYDTYPDNDTMADPFPNDFNGAWGTYPFFESKNIAVVDITYGLNMVTKEKDIYTTSEKISVCDNPGTVQAIDFYAKGDFNTGNTFYLELADANGSFVTAQKIDSLSKNVEGNYSFSFDPTNFTGTKFRFRVSSTNPVIHQSSWLELDYSSTPEVPTIINTDGVFSTSAIAENYQWFVKNEPVIGANENTFTTNLNGNVYLQVSNGGCISQSNNIKLSVDESIFKLNYKLYPNPSINYSYIQNNKREMLNIKVYDATGRLENEFKSVESLIKLNLTKGVHFVKINSAEGQQMIKVVKF